MPGRDRELDIGIMFRYDLPDGAVSVVSSECEMSQVIHREDVVLPEKVEIYVQNIAGNRKYQAISAVH